jgi:outer membrane receptor protein involved in Fe transport
MNRMNRFGLLGTSALGSAAFFGSLALATPAHAQTDCSTLPTQAERDACANQATAEPGTQPATQGGNITVTGSRIARPTLESPVPVTSVSAADLLSQGTINIGDALNDLPQLRSTFSQANSTRFIGTSGLNLLDLRGLGISRTLVLVNGRRHITASPGDYLVDTNTIPDDLLERVDVVTGGSSAIYGSDAVAGVVNFIMKRDFDGIRLSGQGGISSRGDRGSYFGALTVGRNFSEGRGNIAVSAEYSRVNALYNVDRPDLTGAFTGRRQFNLSDDPAGEPAAGDGVPDQTFFNGGVRNGTISDGGEVNAVCTAAIIATRPDRCRPAGFAQRYMFDQTGRLILSNPSLDFRDITNGGSSNTVGGLGSTLNNTGQLDPKLVRYSINLLAHYDISEAFSPYVEAKFVRIKANQEGQPSFVQGGLLGTFRCNNPFLLPDALQTLQAIGQCANPPTSSFAVSRFNVDFGGRGELHQRDTYRIVGGIQGTFNDDWKYDISVNYGELRTKLDSLNNLVLTDINGNFDGYLLAFDAVRNAAGQIVCRVNQVTVTRPDCVPINMFGQNMPSQAALDFVNTTAHRDEKATELDILATLGGDTSSFFELPGGPIRFSIGGEYREETAHSAFDPLTAAGGTFLNAIAPFDPPKLTIKEAFAEVELPILKDLPFADELTVSGAARISDYNSAAGTVWTYSGAVYYAPIHDLRFRANYARSVRAPTQSDLFSSQSQNFNFIADPCDVLNIGGGPNRAANCAAAGVPVGFVNTPARSATLSFLQGGNPNLVSEKSDSYTLGVIFEPRWVRGLSLTVDYYRIHVANLIAVLSAQTIINSCYDAPGGISNTFCANVFRDPTTHFFADPATISGPINFQRQKTKGVDFDLAWNRTMGNGDRFSLRGIFTYVMQRTNYIDPAFPDAPNRQLSELGDPQIEFQVSANYRTGPLSLRYQVQYIGKQTVGTYEQQHAYPGVCPVTPIPGLTCTPGSIVRLPPSNADAFSPVYYPSVIYHNARIGWNIDRKFEWYFGVDNISNKIPPLGNLGVGAGGAIWDNVGRYFYSGFKANF